MSNTQPTTQKRRGRPFVKGFDPRRHIFTAEERSKAFWTTIAVMGIGIGAKLHKSGRWPNFKRRAGR